MCAQRLRGFPKVALVQLVPDSAALVISYSSITLHVTLRCDLFPNAARKRNFRVAHQGHTLGRLLARPTKETKHMATAHTSTATSPHVDALQTKHAGLEARLRDELARPAPDAAAIQAIKRQKLKLKEEIARS